MQKWSFPLLPVHIGITPSIKISMIWLILHYCAAWCVHWIVNCFNACCQKLLCAHWTHTDAKSLSSGIELGDVVIQRYTLFITFCFLVVLHPDLFFSTHIRDAFNQQLRRRQASIWPEAHAISQPWTNVVSETHVCHLWRPLFWWVGALRAGLAAVKQQPDTVYFMVILVWILPHCWMFLPGDESQSSLLVKIKMYAFMLLFVLLIC